MLNIIMIGWSKNTVLFIAILFLFSLVLVPGGSIWAKKETKPAKQLQIIYSGNTSGFTEPTG